MTGLRAALADLALEVGAIPTRQVLPPQSRRPTFLALQKILVGRDLPPARPRPDRLDQVWQALNAFCRAERNLRELPTRDLGDAIWLLWDKGRRASDLAGVMAAVQDLASERPRYLRRFVEAWLRDFEPGDPGIRQTGAWLASAIQRSVAPSLVVWRRAQQRHALFDSPDGPASVLRATLGGGDTSTLQEFGFDTPQRGAGGFMRAVVKEAGAVLPGKMLSPGADVVLDRALTLYSAGEGLRFDEPAMRGGMADALVGAWSRGNPPQPLREKVLAFLLTRLGDPRTQPDKWSQASEQTRAIVRAWLARVTLTAFFGVIGQYAGAAGMGHQWQARQKFWSACLEKGWVDDAWLVLGTNVHRQVARNRALLGNYGRLDEGALSNHSALLMRIRNTVFVEWSHNGRLYAWPAGSKAAPRFWSGGFYAAEDLKSAGLAFPAPANRPDLATLPGPGLTHHADTWRGRVAALLRAREELRIEPWEWA